MQCVYEYLCRSALARSQAPIDASTPNIRCSLFTGPKESHDLTDSTITGLLPSVLCADPRHPPDDFLSKPARQALARRRRKGSCDQAQPHRSSRDQEGILWTKAGLLAARLHDASFTTAIFGLPRHACSPSLYNHLSLDLPKTGDGDKSDRGVWIFQPDQIGILGGTRRTTGCPVSYQIG